jgi:hypothetical protein
MGGSFGLSRRMVLGAGAALLAPTASCAAIPGPADPSPMRCADFLAGIGVNTHIGYLDSQYRDVEAVLEALDFIKVTRVRDAAFSSRAPVAQQHYQALAARGVSFCMFWSSNRPMAEAISDISELERDHPGAVDALEGPNEIKPKFAYAGETGNAAAQKFMSDMRAAARADRRLHGKPLVIFTSYARVAADCDFANQHPYPKGGMQPGELLRGVRERNVGPGGVMPGKPMVFTEFGYHTLVGPPARPAAWQGVDPERQAVLILNGLFDAATLGLTRTYIYQLLDGTPPGGGPPDQERHFGLFRFDGSPKPAAIALRKLASRLADQGPRARDFTLRPPAARAEAASPVASLALQDSAGRDFLALWNESPVWNPSANAPADFAPASVAIKCARPEPIQLFDLIDPANDKRLGTGRATAQVGAHPIILQIG